MTENQIKHLEFIQLNISRMNQNSFQMKGWAIAIISALLAIYAATISESGIGNKMFIFIAIIPALLFWFLDSYYLQQERKFCGIYNDVAGLSSEIDKISIRDFEMPLNKYKDGRYCFCNVMWSRTEWLLYVPIILLLIAGGIFLK